MKNLSIFLLAGIFVCTVIGFNSCSSNKSATAARKETAKLSKEELNAKATKAARSEAKKLAKEGWTTTPGALPLDKQLDKSYLMQYEYDDNNYPKYIMGEAMSTGENYDAAKMQALELSKQNLAGQISTEVTALVENSVANKQLSDGEAASVTESVLASKNLISQSLGRVLPVVEVYRTAQGAKNKEVLVRVAYNHTQALDAAKNAIRKNLEAKGDKMHEQLDKVLGF
jgi:hypothetical protein